MATQQQPRFVPPRFYRQYNLQNRPALPPKPVSSSPKPRSRASTFSKPSETASTNGQLQPPSAHQRSVSMTSPSNSSNSTSDSDSSTRTPPTRPALSLILPNQTTPPDSRSPSQSHLRSASYTIGQSQGHLTPTSQPQRTISETLHTRNPTVPSIITTPVSPTGADGLPGDTRRTSNTSDAPKPAGIASPRPRGPSLSALQAVTRETPLNSHPRSPRESTTAANESRRETADEPEQAVPAATANTESPSVKPESPARSDSPVKSGSSETSKTTTKQAPPLPRESRRPTPESDMAPVADLLRSRPSQIFSENYSSNTTTGGATNYSPYQNASTQPTRSSIAVPTGVRASMPEPPTQSHVQIRNSRLSFTNLKSNLSLNTLLQSQPAGYQAAAPKAPSQSSGSTTSTSTAPSAPPAPSAFSPQPQPVSTPLSPLQSIPVQPQFQPPNTNPDPNPHDAYSLLALTHHVNTQTSQARHLFTELQHYLPFVEKQWIQSTIGDTEAAARDILLLTESMRIDQETNNGKLGLKTQFRWMLRDSRRARERRERLVLCHASLVAVLVRLEGVRAKVPEMGFPASFGEPVGVAAGPTSVPVAPVEISASSPAVQKEFQDEIPVFQSAPPVNAPPPPPKQPTATATVNVEHTSQVYPPPPTAAPPPIPVQVPVQRNSDDLPWELTVQLQDADKELVVHNTQPPPVPPKVKIEEDSYPNPAASITTAAATTTGNANGNTGFNSVTNGSIISGAGTETATGTPRTMSPVSPEGSTKLDNELLDMLEWRWKQGRAA